MDHVSKILTFPATIDLAGPSEGLNEHFVMNYVGVFVCQFYLWWQIRHEHDSWTVLAAKLFHGVSLHWFSMESPGWKAAAQNH